MVGKAVYVSHASEVGSPTNPPAWAPDSDKTWGQGSFGPFTGGFSNSYLQKFLKRNRPYI